ncbi:hypothetical protein BT93_K1554 [Corymbia citriodora subsp. variegata]|nr:hypothetical protein BT93_K1554 [Corymbia citriodora subsp. variegata]
MCRIHPDESRCDYRSHREKNGDPGGGGIPGPSKLTVWKKSSMSFQGTDGFTVFDQRGRLVFRVDNYSRRGQCASGGGGGLVLMDGVGNALLTLRPQVLSMQCQWHAYKGENSYGKRTPDLRVFSMRRSSLLFHNNKSEAEVFLGGCGKHGQAPDFTIEGSFTRRNCIIRSSTGEIAAKISRKRVNTTVLLGDDVFSLVVQPGFDPELAMAFVVILDRICKKAYTPVLCS